MASTQFAHTPKTGIDETLETAARASAVLSKAIKVRLQPTLYDWQVSQYTAWQGLTWIVDCQDVEEGRRLRQGLVDFFRVFGGHERQQQRLLEMLAQLAKRVVA